MSFFPPLFQEIEATFCFVLSRWLLVFSFVCLFEPTWRRQEMFQFINLYIVSAPGCCRVASFLLFLKNEMDKAG